MMFQRAAAFVIGVPIFIIIELIRYRKAKSLSKKFFNMRELFIFMFSFYLMALIAVTMLPLNIHSRVTPKANIIPVFNTIESIASVPPDMVNYMTKFWIINIFGNLLLLAPLATIVPILFKKFKNIKATIILCFFVSLTIELLQYLSMFWGNMRSVDIDDVILNTLGAVIGFLVFKVIDKKVLVQKSEQDFS